MKVLLALVPATLRFTLIAASTSRRNRPQQPAGQPSNGALIRRMLALGWGYRAGCVLVVVQQAILVFLGISGLGLTGLGIDYIRSQLDPNGTPPHWLLGLAPPADWRPTTVVAAIAGAILVVAVAQTWLRYRAAVAVARLTQSSSFNYAPMFTTSWADSASASSTPTKAARSSTASPATCKPCVRSSTA